MNLEKFFKRLNKLDKLKIINSPKEFYRNLQKNAIIEMRKEFEKRTIEHINKTENKGE